MKVATTVILSILLSSLLAQNAMAQPAETKNPTEASSEFTPSFGVNAEPIWLVLGGFGAKFEYFMTDKMSIGVSAMIIPGYKVEETTTTSDDDYIMKHYEFLVGTNYMITGTLGTRGLYVNPAIGYLKAEISEYSSLDLSGSNSGAMLRCTLGYQWVIAKHLRLAAGGGFIAFQGGDIVIKDNTGAVVREEKSSAVGGLALDAHVGYLF